MTKICKKCKQEKSVIEFSFRYKIKGIRQTQCKVCKAAYLKKHYNKDKSYYINKAAKQNTKRKEFIKEAKNIPCTDCKKSYPSYVMDFDHVSEKNFLLSRGCNYGLPAIQKEINNCDVVCANCHRERTHQRLNMVSPLGIKPRSVA